MAARYSKVERRVHRDEKVRKLSHGPPNARELWMYLLTCDAHGGFPGLFLLRLSTIADDLQWPLEAIPELFAEIERAGMLRRDPETSVVWLPRAVAKHAEKLSPANAKGWRNAWEELPDGPVTREAFRAAVAALEAYEDPAKAPELVRAFLGRAPEWWGARAPVEGPKRPPAGGHGAPSCTPRGPVELGQGEDREKDRERRGAPREGGPASPSPELVPIIEELNVGRDLYRPAYVSDEAIADAASRMLRAIRVEPKAKAHDVCALVRDAVVAARSEKTKRPAMTDEGALAKVEEALVKWILGDIRSGRRVAVAAPASGPKGRHEPATPADFAAQADAEAAAADAKLRAERADREQQERARLASRRRGGEAALGAIADQILSGDADGARPNFGRTQGGAS